MHAEVYQESHLPGLYPLFMRLTSHEMTLEQFSLWFKRNAKEAEVFMEDGQVAACGYLDRIRPGSYATVHVAVDPGMFSRSRCLRSEINMLSAFRLSRMVLRGWFLKYDLRRIVAFVPIWELVVSKFAEACGFRLKKVRGPIRKMVLAETEAFK